MMHISGKAKKAQVDVAEYGTWFLVAIFIIMLAVLYILFGKSLAS